MDMYRTRLATTTPLHSYTWTGWQDGCIHFKWLLLIKPAILPESCTNAITAKLIRLKTILFWTRSANHDRNVSDFCYLVSWSSQDKVILHDPNWDGHWIFVFFSDKLLVNVYKYSIFQTILFTCWSYGKWVCFVQEVKHHLELAALRHYYKHRKFGQNIYSANTIYGLIGRLLLEMQTLHHPCLQSANCSVVHRYRQQHNCIYNVTGMVDGGTYSVKIIASTPLR